MPPDRDAAPAILPFLEATRRRRALTDAVESVALAVAIGSVGGWVAAGYMRWPLAISLSTIVAACTGIAWFMRSRVNRTAAATARAIERLRPGCRNTVVTVEELQRHPERASGWIAERVRADASHAIRGLRTADIVPGRRAGFFAAAAVLTLAAVTVMPNARDAAVAVREVGQAVAGRALGQQASTVTVTVRPPAYSGLESRTLTDPDRIEALEGSRVTLSLAAGTAQVRFGTTRIGALATDAALDLAARENGYLAIEHAGGETTLIAVSVTRDRQPAVTIEKPARDLLLPAADRSVPLQLTASDDLGLHALDLRYTKVSGSGEQFEFQEGTVPLTLARSSGREWRATAELALEQMNLGPGDLLVYRAVARDARAGSAGLGASDTYYVEIAGPGQVPLEGVEMPPEEERYALSQQMIVLKIQRLQARERSMNREAVAEEAALLAAEQRSVRANFVFLLGGHVEDEEVEAEQSHEIAEGRLQNTARRDINVAIGHMTRAEQGLVAASTGVALPPARAAVDALQRAFGRSRYLLRSLASRTKLDPSRRLTGNISTASPWRRALPEADPREGERARQLLAALLDADQRLATGPLGPADLTRLQEQALAVDPAVERWQDVARKIAGVRRRSDLQPVIAEVTELAAKGLVPRAGLDTAPSPLERAWRRGGRQ